MQFGPFLITAHKSVMTFACSPFPLNPHSTTCIDYISPIQFNSIQLDDIKFSSVQFHLTQLHSIQLSSDQLKSEQFKSTHFTSVVQIMADFMYTLVKGNKEVMILEVMI